MGDANNNAADAGVAVQQATLPPETTTTDDKQHPRWKKKQTYAEEVLSFTKDVQAYSKANFELTEMFQEAIEKEAEMAVFGHPPPDPNVHFTGHTWGHVPWKLLILFGQIRWKRNTTLHMHESESRLEKYSVVGLPEWKDYGTDAQEQQQSQASSSTTAAPTGTTAHTAQSQ